MTRMKLTISLKNTSLFIWLKKAPIAETQKIRDNFKKNYTIEKYNIDPREPDLLDKKVI